eukprot:COSAG03_NODE_21125_length_308_cov_2.177033_1_plen_22_part_10
MLLLFYNTPHHFAGSESLVLRK